MFWSHMITYFEKQSNIYCTIQKFGIGKSICMILKEVSCAHQGCIYLITNALKSNIVKYYYNLK